MNRRFTSPAPRAAACATDRAWDERAALLLHVYGHGRDAEAAGVPVFDPPHSLDRKKTLANFAKLTESEQARWRLFAAQHYGPPAFAGAGGVDQ